ncbi:hypothetical protein MCOR25_008441 [Pyricularia grisea]|nr:hypothetical protein MCOR25_008441 [Pyricularia grisea]
MESKQGSQSPRPPNQLRRSRRLKLQPTAQPLQSTRAPPRYRKDHVKDSEDKSAQQPDWLTPGGQQRIRRQQRRRNSNIFAVNKILEDQPRAKHSAPYTLASFQDSTPSVGLAGDQPHVKMSLCVGDSLHAAQLLGAERVGFSGAAGTTQAATCRVGVLNMAPPDGGLRTLGGCDLEERGGSERQPMTDHQSLMERTTLYHGLKDLDEWDFREPDNFTVQENILVFADSEDNFGLGDNQNKPKMLPVGDHFYIEVVTAAMFRTQRLEVVDSASGQLSRFVWRNGLEDAVFFWGQSGDDSESDLSGHRMALFPTYQDYWEALTVRMRTILRLFRRQGVNKIVLGAWGVDGLGHHMSDVVDAWKFVILGEAPPVYMKGVKAEEVPAAEGWDGLEVVFAIKEREVADEFRGWYVGKLDTLE